MRGAGAQVGGLSALSLTILRAGGEVGKPIAFALLIVIVAFIPLFTMGGIEGRIFGPMAKTYAYAIAGSLVAAFTIVPALSAVLLREDSEERDTLLVRWLRRAYALMYDAAMRARELALLLAAVLVRGSLFLLSTMGAEFLPTLEEGNLYVRATMPGTISLEEGHATVQRIRATIMEFPEAVTVTSQQGRPDDGTDPAGFFNAEFFVPLRRPSAGRRRPTATGWWPR
jgi:cobalt-zinc-cadmium resistance protein CzcA